MYSALSRPKILDSSLDPELARCGVCWRVALQDVVGAVRHRRVVHNQPVAGSEQVRPLRSPRPRSARAFLAAIHTALSNIQVNRRRHAPVVPQGERQRGKVEVRCQCEHTGPGRGGERPCWRPGAVPGVGSGRRHPRAPFRRRLRIRSHRSQPGQKTFSSSCVVRNPTFQAKRPRSSMEPKR